MVLIYLVFVHAFVVGILIPYFYPPPLTSVGKRNAQTTKDNLERKSQRMCLFIRNLIKMCLFVLKEIRAHKYTWVEAINFG
jgi:hypothetical protein